MKGSVRSTLLALGLAFVIFGVVNGVDASSNYPGIYNSYFGTTPSCSLCHTSPPSLNATGTAFLNAGGNTIPGWTAIKPADTTPPSVTITNPATNPYTATSSSLSIAGSASDNFTNPFGVTQVSWSNSLGGSGTATGTTSWSASVALSSGSNVITVTARDAAGNTGTATRTVNYTAADAMSPTLAITSHTNGQTVSTASITLSGTATDSGRGNSGIQQVMVNGVAATGGTATGSGTANWSRALTLAAGANTITVVASDNSPAHNATTQGLTINYNAPVVDTTGPTLAVTSHTNGQTVNTASITLSGTATDSGRGNSGIQQVMVNGVAASGGTATGSATANWSRALTLAAGANSITVVASDNSTAHNTTTQNFTINYSTSTADTTGPTLAITSHTNGQTVSTASITLSGTATDSGRGNSGIQQVMVNGVAASGGTATGSATANWSRGLKLTAGANSITVVAYDSSASHNTVTRNLTINYKGGSTSQAPPQPPPDNLPSFSHPTQITNPYFPLARMRRHTLEGTVGGQQVRIVRTLKNRTESFQVGDQTVRTLVMEDRAYVDGELEEVALDYFAQADDGTVYYFGEDVNIYSNGKVVSHEGAWRYGVDTNQLGVIMPARPKVGTTFQPENVLGITAEDNEVLSVSETVRVPAGRFRNCLKVQETLPDKTIEFKYYAPNVGVVKEVTEGGSLDLISVGHSEEGDHERD